jgi:Transglutaminase-like superfamily
VTASETSTRPTPSSADPLPRLAKVALTLEILATYVRARWLLLRHDLPATLLRLRGTDDVAGVTTYAFSALRLSHAVTRVLAALPMDAKCLVRSLVLTAVLSRRGIASTVVIGVRPGDSFAAHAWVETSGRAILPRQDYARLHTL